MPEWINKLAEALNVYNNGKDNPTTNSLLMLLSNMSNQLAEYKQVGTIEESRRYKEIALSKQKEDTNKEGISQL